MIIDDLLALRHMTRYRLAVQAGIPHATLSDICNGKTKLERCSAETVYKAALKRMFPKINLENIHHFIDQAEAITDLQKEFYKTYIDARYNLILLPSYQLISSIQ